MNANIVRQDIDPLTPVIIGAGQYTAPLALELELANGPVFMASQAVKAALADTQCSDMAAYIDTVLCVRTFGDSGPLFSCPFGTSGNMPAAIARAAGIQPRRNVYDIIGGNSPQSLVAQAAEEIEAGASRAVLICGGEAIANMKAAIRAGVSLDWSGDIKDAPLEDRGPFSAKAPPLMSRSAEQHELFAPIQYYGLLENMRRANEGVSRADYQRDMAHIMGGILQTAQQNPFSVFADINEDLESVTPANPLFTDIYSKSILPKDGVNQGAAIIMTSYGRACELGINPDRFIYLHAHVEGSEPPVLQRPDLDRSPVLRACIKQVLNAAGIGAQDIAIQDLYSCFPIVLRESTAALGMDPYKDRLTLTGGLAFFGGAGNNYSMHGIAEMTKALRAAPGKYGLIHANGGYMSKHAVGIYSTKPAQFPAPIMRHMAENGRQLETIECVQRQDEKAQDIKEQGIKEQDIKEQGIIETYCVSYRKGEPAGAIMIGRLKENGKRFYAKPDESRKAEILAWLIEADPFGAPVNLSSLVNLPNNATQNYFTRA